MPPSPQQRRDVWFEKAKREKEREADERDECQGERVTGEKDGACEKCEREQVTSPLLFFLPRHDFFPLLTQITFEEKRLVL